MQRGQAGLGQVQCRRPRIPPEGPWALRDRERWGLANGAAGSRDGGAVRGCSKVSRRTQPGRKTASVSERVASLGLSLDGQPHAGAMAAAGLDEAAEQLLRRRRFRDPARWDGRQPEARRGLPSARTVLS